MAEITIGQTITTQQYADTVDKSLPYSHNAFLFYVDVTLISQDEVNATSRITIRHRLKCIRSYWSNYSNIYGEIAIGTDVKDTKHLATTELGKTYTLGTWTGDVAHDEDGELTITVNGNWYGDYGSSRYSPENNVLTNIIDFPAIQRVSKLSVTPATLTSGNLSISITKYVSTYTTTVKYKVEGTEYTLATKSAATSFSLSFNALKALIGSFTSSVVEITAITYDNDYEIGSDRKSIIVQTGKIPLSLYDNRQGSVGVTFGEEATGKDIHFKLPVHFYNEVYGLPSTTYKPNDILRLDFYGIYAGVLTAGRREIGFTLFLDKPIDESVTGVNIGSIKCNISTYGNVYLGRGSSWYNGGYEYVGVPGYEVEVNWKAGLSAITIWINKSSAYTSTTALNNSAVIIRAEDLIINFS